MRTEKAPRTRRYWAALILLLLGTLAGAWHNHQVDRGKTDIVVGAVRGVVAPPATALGRASRWFRDQTSWIFQGHALAAENRSLRARVAELEGENASLREAQIDYDRLRGDLGFVHTAKTALLSADVIARRPDPKFDTLVITRGSADGVQPKSVVVTRDGVVGRVFEVTRDTASVLMLTDQNSGVGARVQRPASRATGICKGDNSAALSLVYLPTDADIKAGDVIVTSGLGGIYPAGLVIGTVVDVRAEEGNILKSARLRPKVDFDRLEQVYVLR
jgi:rod shape-determining protein MreC